MLHTPNTVHTKSEFFRSPFILVLVCDKSEKWFVQAHRFVIMFYMLFVHFWIHANSGKWRNILCIGFLIYFSLLLLLWISALHHVSCEKIIKFRKIHSKCLLSNWRVWWMYLCLVRTRISLRWSIFGHTIVCVCGWVGGYVVVKAQKAACLLHFHIENGIKFHFVQHFIHSLEYFMIYCSF